MRNPLNAAMMAAFSGMLAMIFPPAILFSNAVVALVALRQGSSGSGSVLAITVVVGMVLGYILMGSPLPIFGMILMYWLPTWGLAIMLRSTGSLPFTLLGAAGFGAIVVLLFYLMLGDPVLWWREMLSQVMEMVVQQMQLQLEPDQLEYVIARTASMATGVLGVTTTLTLIGGLLLARWWQSLLYNPGGFGDDFRELRLGRQAAIGLLAMMLLGMVSHSTLVSSLAFVFAAPFVFQGVALIHAAVARGVLRKAWLTAFYVLLFFAMQPILMMLLVAGIIDAWVDVRSRIKPRAN